MTLQNPSLLTLPNIYHLEAPLILDSTDISIVIPVKNNTSDIRRLINNFFDVFQSEEVVREIIIVDDGSKIPLSEQDLVSNTKVPIQIIYSGGIGPAGARNKGYKAASGNWILFIDSDCIPTSSLIDGYRKALNGSVAYAGFIKAMGSGLLAKFYDTQEILVPFGIKESGKPHHIITANTLIWRNALEAVNGFDHHFTLAAGEDVDIGLRLSQIGKLTYVPDSVIIHDYGKLLSFIRRFFRYGRANTMLEKKYSVNFAPRKAKLNTISFFNKLLVNIQYVVTYSGYYIERMK